MNRTICLTIALLTVLAGCGAPRYMRAAEAQAPAAAPPAGKALVNFHRPSGYGGGADMTIFDGERLIGNLKGKCRFQYVCDPGAHTFISWKDHVTVIEASLAADQVYDVVVDVTPGVWQINISMDALQQGDERRAKVAEWEEHEQLLVLVRDAAAEKYERAEQNRIAEIQRDFLNGGEKSDRVQHLTEGDHR